MCVYNLSWPFHDTVKDLSRNSWRHVEESRTEKERSRLNIGSRLDLTRLSVREGREAKDRE